MTVPVPTSLIGFEGYRRIASGPAAQVALAVKQVIDRGPAGPILVFDEATGALVDIDCRGTAADVAARLTESAAGQIAPAGGPRRAGRPKLGVIGREVTLLPRHWDWLSAQPGGASVALRKLVDQARKENHARDMRCILHEAAYRFMAAIGGDLAGFEEASRALFADDLDRLDRLIEPWPVDIRDHLRELLQRGEQQAEAVLPA